MTSAPDEAAPPDDSEEGPVYRAVPSPQDVPPFLLRVLTYIDAETPEGDFAFEGVDFDIAGSLWLASIAGYDPDEDEAAAQAPAGTVSAWGEAMLQWVREVQEALRGALGEPVVHEPTAVGEQQEPEGIIDILLHSQGFEYAELWEHGEHAIVMMTHWYGDPGWSQLGQIVVVMPREMVHGGMGAVLSDEDTEHALLMHGEHPLELRRRAWLLSTIGGQGEVRLRDTPLEGSRFSVLSRRGVAAVWTFADDGRALLLVQDPRSAVARSLQAESTGEESDEASNAGLARRASLLDGVPSDLRAAIWARGETAGGDVAEQHVAFDLLDGEPIPQISGVFWFAGDSWHVSRGLMELSRREGFGIDDHGFDPAVRRPLRLGGSFTASDIAAPNEPDPALQRLFDACPYPEQARPEGDVLLGYSIPLGEDQGEIATAVEQASRAGWDVTQSDAPLVIGGRRLSRAGDPAVLQVVLGQAPPWTVTALTDWSDRLAAAMTERWGEPAFMSVHDADGIKRRTPLTRVMRGFGLAGGPLWWVDGHAVVLLTGTTNPEYFDGAQAMLVICQADTLLELTGRTSLWETRLRTRVLANVVSIIAESAGHERASASTVPWGGKPLPGLKEPVPATRGGLRAGTFFWAWHFTSDGRALLTSHELGAEPGDFAVVAARFEGLPEDLLSLVADAEPGPYPVVERTGELEGPGGSVRTLPDAAAVFFYDGHDWRAPMGMLRQAHATSLEADVTPMAALYSADVGVPQLQFALRNNQRFSVTPLADPEYAEVVFGRSVTPEEVAAAFERLVPPLNAALTGSLNDLLDSIVDGPGQRQLLESALANPDPTHRRQNAMWLLNEGVDPSQQLFHLTPINVLLANPTLGADDAPVLRGLLGSGADPGFGLLGEAHGTHPVVQLCDRDAAENELEPLVEDLVAWYDGPLPPSVSAYARAGRFPHSHPRTRLASRVADLENR